MTTETRNETDTELLIAHQNVLTRLYASETRWQALITQGCYAEAAVERDLGYDLGAEESRLRKMIGR